MFCFPWMTRPRRFWIQYHQLIGDTPWFGKHKLWWVAVCEERLLLGGWDPRTWIRGDRITPNNPSHKVRPWTEGVPRCPILRGRKRSPWLLTTSPSHGARSSKYPTVPSTLARLSLEALVAIAREGISNCATKKKKKMKTWTVFFKNTTGFFLNYPLWGGSNQKCKFYGIWIFRNYCPQRKAFFWRNSSRLVRDLDDNKISHPESSTGHPWNHSIGSMAEVGWDKPLGGWAPRTCK